MTACMHLCVHGPECVFRLLVHICVHVPACIPCVCMYDSLGVHTAALRIGGFLSAPPVAASIKEGRSTQMNCFGQGAQGEEPGGSPRGLGWPSLRVPQVSTSPTFLLMVGAV